MKSDRRAAPSRSPRKPHDPLTHCHCVTLMNARHPHTMSHHSGINFLRSSQFKIQLQLQLSQITDFILIIINCPLDIRGILNTSRRLLNEASCASCGRSCGAAPASRPRPHRAGRAVARRGGRGGGGCGGCDPATNACDPATSEQPGPRRGAALSAAPASRRRR
jgi:hypothetical protein